MSHEDRPPGGPPGATDDAIILHVPGCVQQFSSRRRILSRLRALARRRSRGLPELEAAPLTLHVEENSNWQLADEELAVGQGIESPRWVNEELFGADFVTEIEPGGGASISDEDMTPPPVSDPPREERPDPNLALISQLEEDNRDLKAALCRLIHIAEENEGALRLLEAENEELSALVHRLTIGQTKAVAATAMGASARWRLPWVPVPAMARLGRRVAR